MGAKKLKHIEEKEIRVYDLISVSKLNSVVASNLFYTYLAKNYSFYHACLMGLTKRACNFNSLYVSLLKAAEQRLLEEIC